MVWTFTNIWFYKSRSRGALGDPVDPGLVPEIIRKSEARLAALALAVRQNTAVPEHAAALATATTSTTAPSTALHTTAPVADTAITVQQCTMSAVLCYLYGQAFTRKDSVGHHIKRQNGRIVISDQEVPPKYC